jgi:cell volume regulation protein A
MSALEIGQVIAAVGAIGLAVLLLQPIASRLRLPDPLLFLGLGVVLAQWSRVTDAVTADVVQVVGTVALIVILADGGLRCGARTLRRVLAPVLTLGIGGTLITFGVVAVLAHELTDLPWT